MPEFNVDEGQGMPVFNVDEGQGMPVFNVDEGQGTPVINVDGGQGPPVFNVSCTGFVQTGCGTLYIVKDHKSGASYQLSRHQLQQM